MKKTKIEIKDSPLQPIKGSKVWMITPKKIALIIFAIFLIFVAWYFYREICFLIKAPKLEVFQPPADISTTQKTFEIIGKTDSTAYLLVNEQETYLDREGNFKAEVNLVDGVNTIKIESKNRFNKNNIIIRRIIYSK
ncbi:hypothetical protein KKF60_01835 [Patescibacteria group bacterium]|nr:hypothetical protein [Patescibacteria group bacterium]MBU4458621.1 hypothetical protein [Patescibacteria group bacterium]MCG2695947.1 hypothetical protein [Candidatus Portnoybacteria bacterium]